MKITYEIKRKAIQIAAFGFSNLHPGNFAKGQIYKGSWKQFCNPGLRCYSCPAASVACPIGAMQAVSGSMDFTFLYRVHDHAQNVQEASDIHKDVENRVYPFFLAANAIQHRPDGVGNAAGEEQVEARGR